MRVSLEALRLRRGGFELALDLDWSAAVLLLTGASGSGKTLLLRLLAGLERPEAGVLRCDGEVWAEAGRALPPHRRPISLMFQDERLFPHLDVLDNLCFAGAAAAEARALAVRFGVEALLSRRIDRLSGGEKQRIAMLRALLRPARLLLLDEPTAALNAELRLSWLQELRAIQRERDLQLVYVTHHPDEHAFWPEAASLSLDGGRLREWRPGPSSADSNQV